MSKQDKLRLRLQYLLGSTEETMNRCNFWLSMDKAPPWKEAHGNALTILSVTEGQEGFEKLREKARKIADKSFPYAYPFLSEDL